LANPARSIIHDLQVATKNQPSVKSRKPCPGQKRIESFGKVGHLGIGTRNLPFLACNIVEFINDP
jgi:hypothetical protein